MNQNSKRMKECYKDIDKEKVYQDLEAIKILKGTKGVAIVRLDDSDVVRNKLVIKIIEAYKNTSNK